MGGIEKAMYRCGQIYRLATSSVRLMPDFIIIGGMRCGTTSLYNYLLEHAGILPASVKEVHYFDYHFDRPLFWYRAQFPSIIQKVFIEEIQKHRCVTGEASPYYLFHPLSPIRIAKTLPRVKLIALLRNPIDRAYSQHWLESKLGYDTLPFEEAIEREEERLAGEREKMLTMKGYESYSYRHYSYVSRGIYVDQLQYWMKYCPQEQFLILRSEDLYSNPAAIVRQTLDFLGFTGEAPGAEQSEYKNYREPTSDGYKSEQKPPKMRAETRAHLVEYFKPHNARLSEWAGRDFGWDQ
jgi:hypothetical protein